MPTCVVRWACVHRFSTLDPIKVHSQPYCIFDLTNSSSKYFSNTVECCLKRVKQTTQCPVNRPELPILYDNPTGGGGHVIHVTCSGIRGLVKSFNLEQFKHTHLRLEWLMIKHDSIIEQHFSTTV